MVLITRAVRRAKFQSNHHHQQTNTQFFYRPDTIPVAQPTVKALKGKSITFHRLAQPKLTWGPPTLLARKTPLRKPNRGEQNVSRKPRPTCAVDFLGLSYCFIVLSSVFVVSWPSMVYFPTPVSRYSLFMLKVSLNTKQTNKQTSSSS